MNSGLIIGSRRAYPVGCGPTDHHRYTAIGADVQINNFKPACPRAAPAILEST